MKIKYLGHSCFVVTSNNYAIVLDPFKDVRGFNDVELTANEVICSHSHFDHAYTEKINLIKADSPFNNYKLSAYHDECKGSKRGLNDINILCAENKKLVHLGDLGHELDDNYLKELKDVDVLMIPIGGTYTINDNQALKIINDINPKYIIPMHYKDGNKGLEVLAEINEFLIKAKEYQDRLLLVRGYQEEIEIWNHY